jgi:hypothetical protein
MQLCTATHVSHLLARPTRRTAKSSAPSTVSRAGHVDAATPQLSCDESLMVGVVLPEQVRTCVCSWSQSAES